MSDLKGYQLLASAFAAEGVDRVFTLMGDGNMFWATALAREHGVRLIHARHEHSAVAMAEGYARKTGRVGIASTTCGPGFTQIMTALTVAVRQGTPVIVFAGDTPTTDAFHNQEVDQKPFALATGARFIAVRTADRMLECVREAFYVARYERCPVVLSVPMDLQDRVFDWAADYQPSDTVMPRAQAVQPDPALVSEVATMLAAASRPIIIAGEGAMRSGAAAALEALAEQSGALLATTLRAKGLFDHNPWAIGISGAFSSDVAREFFASADLVVAAGASLTAYATEQGYLFPNAKVVQVDISPRGFWQGLRVADLHVRGDAKATATAIGDALRGRGPAREGFRTREVGAKIAAFTPDARPFPIEAGTFDPRAAVMELDRVIPPDWDIVVGCAHFFNFVVTHMRGRAAERWFIAHAFGAIGQGLPTAIGVAVARGDPKVVLVEGDGSLLMHVQELEALARHGIRLLICVLNDGAYGAEVHKLVPAGVDPGEAIFGRTDLAAVSRGFQLAGHTVTDLGNLRALLEQYAASGKATLLDIPVSREVPSQQYRRLFWGET